MPKIDLAAVPVRKGAGYRAGLVRRLPAAQLQRSFRLRLVTAHLKLYARDFDALEADLQGLESELDAMDARQRYGVTLLRAGLALMRDDTDAAVAILPALQAIPDDAETYAFVGRNQVLAWLHMQRGEYEQARANLSELSSRRVGLGRRLLSRCLEGMSYALEGRLADAERTLREVLQEADGNPVVDSAIACIAAGLLSDALYESNDLEAACTLLEPRIELIERAAIPDAVLRALMMLALSHWVNGRRLEALSWLERLEDYGIDQGLDRPLSYALYLRLRVHLWHGETPQAEQVLARIEALAARHGTVTPGTVTEIVRNAERGRVLMSLYWNDFDAAVNRLVPLIASTESAGRWRVAASLQLQLAIAQEGRGNHPAAREVLIDVLRRGHRLGLMRSLLDMSSSTSRMLQALLDEQVLDPVLTFYARRLIAAGDRTPEGVAQPAEHAGGVTLDVLSEREFEVLNLVAQAMPNKKIARVLGVSTHTVKWHLRKIYAKLDATKRDEAVARMRDLEARESIKPR
jgi:LuxR family maltose regulon positive regulatory protein